MIILYRLVHRLIPVPDNICDAVITHYPYPSRITEKYNEKIIGILMAVVTDNHDNNLIQEYLLVMTDSVH